LPKIYIIYLGNNKLIIIFAPCLEAMKEFTNPRKVKSAPRFEACVCLYEVGLECNLENEKEA